MSQPKFAAITASLLARKGEAAPWEEPGRKPLAWRSDIVLGQGALPPPPPPMPERAKAAPPPPPPGSGKLRKCAISMTAGDYERLGIIAVKQTTTRQQLLQQALSDFFSARASEYRSQCPCLGACDSGCGG